MRLKGVFNGQAKDLFVSVEAWHKGALAQVRRGQDGAFEISVLHVDVAEKARTSILIGWDNVSVATRHMVQQPVSGILKPVNREGSPMLENLVRQVSSVRLLQTKLILVLGAAGKSALLEQLSLALAVPRICLGTGLARKLTRLAGGKRHLAVADSLREAAAAAPSAGPVLLDNLEILFDKQLASDPLYLLRQLAHSRVVVATWPGSVKSNRLTYAEIGHPEHRDYPATGFVPFHIQ
jgi:hypothetical protein